MHHRRLWITTLTLLLAAACRADNLIAPASLSQPSFGVAPDPGVVGGRSVEYNAGTGFLVVIADVEQGLFEAAARNKLGLALELGVEISNRDGQVRIIGPTCFPLDEIKSFEIVPGPHVVAFPVNVPWDGKDEQGAPFWGSATVAITTQLVFFPHGERKALSRASTAKFEIELPAGQ